MALELVNPEQLPRSPAYTQVVVARGARTVFISGQVAFGAQPGDDVAAQAPVAYRNLAAALEAVGLRPESVAKITTFVVDYRPEHLPAIAAAREAVFGEHRPASTLLGVAALARPEFLIEVEATAVAD